MGKRIEWFDALKGFSILLVVYCHYVILPDNTILGNVFMTLATGAVPCFLMVSGALMHSAASFSWKKYFKRLFKLYLSIFIWKTIYLVGACAVYDISFSKSDFFKYMFLFGSISGVPSSVMWYMVALLLAMLVFPLSYFLFHQKDSNGKGFNFLLLLTFISGFFVPFVNYILEVISKIFNVTKTNINDLYQILPFRQYSNTLFFFLLGAFLFKRKEVIKERLNSLKLGKLVPFVMIASGIAGLMILKFTMSGTFLWKGTFINEGYSRVSAISLAVGLWLCFSNNEGSFSRFLSKHIGKYTMGIYYLHFIFLFGCAIYIYPHITTKIIGMNFIKTIITTVISLIITKAMLRIPFIKEIVK